MQYSTLIAQIEADIYSNGAELITGDILQTVLKRMVSAWASAGAAYGGTISPDTVVPLNLDQATVYLALTAGTYEHFLDGNGDPIETTGPALVIYDGGPALIFTKTDLPSGGSGATVITVSPGDSLVITLPKAAEGIKASYRIDMTAAVFGGDEDARYIGSLIIECNELATQTAHGYYNGDDMADILSEVAIWKDDPEIYPDEQSYYLLLTTNSNLNEVIFSVSSLDGQSVDADAANEDEKVKVVDANITPVGGGSSDVFVAEYGVTTLQEISDAVSNGKAVLCNKNGATFSLVSLTSSYCRFNALNNSTSYYFVVNSPQTWSQLTSKGLEETDNRVSTISGNETSTTKYPNTKAVADALGVWGVESQTITFNADGTRTLTNVVWGIIPQGEHNIYLSCRGVEFNDTDSAISKTAPWGETIQHLPGYYYLNGLGDISRKEMAIIYAESNALTYDITRARFQSCHFRTIIPASVTAYNWASGKSASALFQHCSNLEVIQYAEITPNSANENIPDLTSMQGFATYAYNLYYAGVWKCGSSSNVTYVAYARTKYLWLKGLKVNVDIHYSQYFDLGCLAYIITNAGTATITITVHANVYTAAQSDAGVQAALAAKTNVSLASA